MKKATEKISGYVGCAVKSTRYVTDFIQLFCLPLLYIEYFKNQAVLDQIVNIG